MFYSSTMKVDAKYTFEMSLGLQRTTGRYSLEDRNFYYHRCEHLKSQVQNTH